MRLVVALILLVAAGLKAYQLATVPSLGEGLFHARWFNIFVVEFELFFGVWLLFGMLPKLTWLATTMLFSIFALVSLYKAISGEISCGCFGNVEVNPWITAGVDLAVIGCLLVFCPRKRLSMTVDIPSTNHSESYWLVCTLLMTVVLILVITIQIYLFFGSFLGLGRFMTVQEVTFVIDKSFHSPEGNTVQIVVENKTPNPITLVGARTDCKCGKIENIPVSFLPFSQSQILFVASVGIDKIDKSKRKQKIIFFVDIYISGYYEILHFIKLS
ncbi:hypothetical protein FACS189427_13290 [Planctomycetales bacterium]|nr:hypothetical protein FACS189427_13290 [Planctomycetales bacterium]